MKNYKKKNAYLVEFLNGNDEIVYAHNVDDLIKHLRNYTTQKNTEWESFMDVTDFLNVQLN